MYYKKGNKIFNIANNTVQLLVLHYGIQIHKSGATVYFMFFSSKIKIAKKMIGSLIILICMIFVVK